MLYLIFAIILGCLFTVVFKFCQKHQIDCQEVTFLNYLFGVLVTCIPVGAAALVRPEVDLSSYMLNGRQIALAAGQGALYMVGLAVMDRSVWRSGVALTTVASRSSLVLSVLLSWVIFGGDRPSWLAIILVIIAMVAIIGPATSFPHEGLPNRTTDPRLRKRKAIAMLLATFIFFGISDTGMKVCQNSVAGCGTNAMTSVAGFIFVTSTLVALGQCLVMRSFKVHPLTWKCLAAGLVLGVVNIFYTRCVIHALASMETSVFYPVNNIGVVALSTLVGLVAFKEKLKWPQIAGIVLAVGAIALFFV